MTDPDLTDIAGALRDLAAALRPALNPATRPTWEQQRWAPGPDAFGAVADPRAATDAGGWPAHVVADELIESAWGNAVVDALFGVRLKGGEASMPSTATLNGAQILRQTITPLPYPTRIFVTANGYAGSDASQMDGTALTIGTDAGVSYSTPAGAGSPANRFGLAAASTGWSVAANASPGFWLAVSWAGTGGGTTFVAANLSWQMYRA